MDKQLQPLDIEDFAADAERGDAGRKRIRDFLLRRYSPRIHMSIILSSCGFAAMVASWTLLHVGVHSMLVRYPIAMGLAYATFLFGVWAWLAAMGIGGARASLARNTSGFDGPSGGSSGGSGGGSGSGGSGGGFAGRGGSFDGGGANASWGEPPAGAPTGQPSTMVQAASRSGARSSSGSGFGLDIDGDGLVLLLLAALLMLVVLCTSGYLIWTAPDVLTEAAFGAALTGTLSKAARDHADSGWVAGVVRKTWWPFALVLLAALAFAGWSAYHYPQAHTFREAIVAAVHSHAS